MTTEQIAKIKKAKTFKDRDDIISFAGELLDFMGIAREGAPRGLTPQTQTLRHMLAFTPHSNQPQLYRMSTEGQRVRAHFAVFKNLDSGDNYKKIHRLTLADVGLGSIQGSTCGLTTANAEAIANHLSPPYSLHIITAANYRHVYIILDNGVNFRVIPISAGAREQGIANCLPAFLRNFGQLSKLEMIKAANAYISEYYSISNEFQAL